MQRRRRAGKRRRLCETPLSEVNEGYAAAQHRTHDAFMLVQAVGNMEPRICGGLSGHFDEVAFQRRAAGRRALDLEQDDHGTIGHWWLHNLERALYSSAREREVT